MNKVLQKLAEAVPNIDFVVDVRGISILLKLSKLSVLKKLGVLSWILIVFMFVSSL